jgi:uncharacterized ferredoxin-like protein
MTGKLKLYTEIITDEDFEPILDILETLGETSAFQRHDAVAFRHLMDKGMLPPVLLIGADITEPAMWNCGACGFKTCGEYMKYTKTNKGVGKLATDPPAFGKLWITALPATGPAPV